MYLRFTVGLREFLKVPVTLEQARAIIKERLASRERNLLAVVKRAIYENKRSPYLRLLKLAGCDYGDFERMIQVDGIECTLLRLRREGVYMSLEEFKGMKEVVRGSQVYGFRGKDFDNPLLARHFEVSSGGSRSAGTRIFYDLDYLTHCQAPYALCLLDAIDALKVPIVVWRPTMPGNGPRKVLEYTKIGKPPLKWFTPVSRDAIKPSLKNRLGTDYISYMGRAWGAPLPKAEYVSVDEADKVAQCVAEATSKWGGCFIHTNVSNAVRICQAASKKGLNISGAQFTAGAEPLTAMKHQAIRAAIANAYPRYSSSESGYVGFGCLHAEEPDDVHLFKDILALVQHTREVHNSGISVDAFLFTSLSIWTPKILLNVELGDYGIITSRNCGCYWDELGFSDHIHNIRSFDKLTSEGMTFLGTDLIRIMEEVLPSRFGGTTIDYQMIEEEDEQSCSRMSILVSPDVGEIDEAEVVKTVLDELSRGKDTQRMMSDVWSQSGTLKVKRIRPFTTAAGKLLPLHIKTGLKP